LGEMALAKADLLVIQREGVDVGGHFALVAGERFRPRPLAGEREVVCIREGRTDWSVEESRMLRISAAVCVVLGVSGGAHGEHWPQFRGPGGIAAADKMNLPDTWSKDKNVLWRADIPGHGWSSPVVWGDRVFLTYVLNDK